MSPRYRPTRTHLAIFCSLLALVACQAQATNPPDASYYAVEINGTPCGYAWVRSEPATLGGRQLTTVEQKIFVMVTVLGSSFNTEIESRFLFDPLTERMLEAKTEIQQGPTEIDVSVKVEGDVARFRSSLGSQERDVELSPDVIFENPSASPHLVRDFVNTDTEEKTYPVFALIEGEIHQTRYTRAGSETLELAGETHETIILDSLDLKNAVKMRQWLDVTDGRAVKLQLPNGREIHLARPSVVKKIEVVNLDSTITARVDASIPDMRTIRYMKVRAKIEPTGLEVTPESLNVPGQKFEGTVEENLVQGVFEIEHPIYDGAEAPPFPPDFAADESLRPFLEPWDLIESRDPELIEEARRITAGAADSWEAVQRLATWVAEEIDYAIPGGGTAARTYRMRAGECGSHSNLLAAFARGVGIPARVVWGCMYIPNFGGAFGQHAWNEVYMGKAGWIPLDATAFETSFVDSGHIRVGLHQALSTALNPIEMEVLDYRLTTSGAAVDLERTAGLERYLGSFAHVEGALTVEVRVQEGALVVDIPDKALLPLHDPDEEARWVCKLTDRVYVTFETGEEGSVDTLKLHELVRMRRTSTPETIDPSIPEDLRRYLGGFTLAMLNAEFSVRYENGGLVVHDPTKNETIGLEPPGADGGWLDEYGKNTVFFETDDEGNVTQLTVDAVTTFRRT